MKSHEEKKPVVLDVRKLIASGVEPYPLIREKVDALAPGQRLELVTPFLPAPLIEKLGSEGFQSRVEVARSEQKWVVHFWKERQP